MVEIVLFERGVGHFERKFQERGSQTNEFWLKMSSCGFQCVRKLDSLGYHVVLFA